MGRSGAYLRGSLVKSLMNSLPIWFLMNLGAFHTRTVIRENPMAAFVVMNEVDRRFGKGFSGVTYVMNCQENQGG